MARLLHDEPWRAGVDWPAGFEAGVAHRLDVSTSGALWVASDLDELAWMRSLFVDRRLVKSYRLVAARDVPWSDNRCDRPIAHAKGRRDRMVVQRGASTPHRGHWYEADTRFVRVRGRLFEATITTGVMHQIRVHAAFLGMPLAGDRTYGGGPTPEDAPPGVAFLLHHLGLVGPHGAATDPVPLPEWAVS